MTSENSNNTLSIESLAQTAAARLGHKTGQSMTLSLHRLKGKVLYLEDKDVLAKVDENEKLVVYIDPIISSQRASFKLAYALGMYLLEYSSSRDKNWCVKKDNDTSTIASRRAGDFAINFLLPSDFMNNHKHLSNRQIAHLANVAHDVVLVRRAQIEKRGS